MTIAPHHLGGSGPQLVLLHGLTASWRVWLPILPALEEHHTVFAPSLAGHVGGPLLDDGAGSVPTLADALERTLDSAGIERAHLVGNSLGGWLALELARRGRAETVVALSPAGSWQTRFDHWRIVTAFELNDRMLRGQRERLVAMLRRPRLRRLLLLGSMEHGERVPLGVAVDMLDDAISTTALAGFLEWVRTATPLGPAGLDGVPIRIAWGEKDRAIPLGRHGEPMYRALPFAERVSLPGCGHVPMYDDPALVARTILEVTARRLSP